MSTHTYDSSGDGGTGTQPMDASVATPIRSSIQLSSPPNTLPLLPHHRHDNNDTNRIEEHNESDNGSSINTSEVDVALPTKLVSLAAHSNNTPESPTFKFQPRPLPQPVSSICVYLFLFGMMYACE